MNTENFTIYLTTLVSDKMDENVLWVLNLITYFK